ncbi:hypothetical protein LOD99_9766 [Oopsacas minuta]|uniref:Uncharacterized protein n=1 Tax=Oopsacas minuta TaxID=111878 RepID=A0AAV7KMD0_9METZ|nr:hypothetical protein LOD99_9766 [Oopsacas minuta]
MGTRTRDEICKKWYNTLTKYMPRIVDTIASAKRTGEVLTEGCLDELEVKIFSIKGKDAFEGIGSDIDLSLERPFSVIIEDESIIISPTHSEEFKIFKETSAQIKSNLSAQRQVDMNPLNRHY